MARRRSKSVKAITDKSRPWSDRIATARKAVEQIPSADWKRGVLLAFLQEVEQELVVQQDGSRAEGSASPAA